MSMNVMIRRYEPGDEEVVLDLWSRAARQAHPFIPDEGRGERARKMREIYLRQADNWVAELDQTVVGLLGMIGSEIGGLFVAPEAHRRGIGRMLVEHALAMHGNVTLEVYEGNATARAVYDRLGFTELARRVDADTGHTMIALRKETQVA
ncbi:GNAT family N-acetyltransferase [Nocardia donostiensis]|nr:GNAT family N-acetyltransferase [Nocardia donostiensis]